MIPTTDKQSALLGVMSKSKISSDSNECNEFPILDFGSNTKIPSWSSE